MHELFKQSLDLLENFTPCENEEIRAGHIYEINSKNICQSYGLEKVVEKVTSRISKHQLHEFFKICDDLQITINKTEWSRMVIDNGGFIPVEVKVIPHGMLYKNKTNNYPPSIRVTNTEYQHPWVVQYVVHAIHRLLQQERVYNKAINVEDMVDSLKLFNKYVTDKSIKNDFIMSANIFNKSEYAKGSELFSNTVSSIISIDHYEKLYGKTTRKYRKCPSDVFILNDYTTESMINDFCAKEMGKAYIYLDTYNKSMIALTLKSMTDNDNMSVFTDSMKVLEELLSNADEGLHCRIHYLYDTKDNIINSIGSKTCCVLEKGGVFSDFDFFKIEKGDDDIHQVVRSKNKNDNGLYRTVYSNVNGKYNTKIDIYDSLSYSLGN